MARFALFVLVLFLSACDLPQATSKVELPDPQSEGAQFVQKFCSDCHAPPSPSTHTAEEWPNIIYRMQERRRMKAFVLIGEHEQAVMLKYLQQHAKSV